MEWHRLISWKTISTENVCVVSGVPRASIPNDRSFVCVKRFEWLIRVEEQQKKIVKENQIKTEQVNRHSRAPRHHSIIGGGIFATSSRSPSRSDCCNRRHRCRWSYHLLIEWRHIGALVHTWIIVEWTLTHFHLKIWNFVCYYCFAVFGITANCVGTTVGTFLFRWHRRWSLIATIWMEISPRSAQSHKLWLRFDIHRSRASTPVSC